MWLADLFSSRRINRFFELTGRHAGLLVQATSLFKEYCSSGIAEIPGRINELRVQGGDVLNELNTALRDSYVTPLDRQDIYNLGETVDDMLNYVNNAAREINLFGVAVTPQMLEVAVILDAAAHKISEAIGDLRRNPQRAWQCAQQIQQAEAQVEDRYRNAVLELFEGPDYHAIFKQREIYRHLSNSADRALAVGRLIGKIVVKAT